MNFKKIAGMLLIIFMSALQILFLFVLVYTLVTDEGPERNQTAFSFIFVMAIFAFPLHYGFKLWRAGKVDSIPKPAPGEVEKTIQFNSKIDFPDYRKLMLKLTYTHPSVLYLNVIGLSILVTSFLNSDFSLIGIFTGFLFIVLPLATVIQSKRNYNVNNMLKETSYEFNAKNIFITGETFNSTIQWSSLYKVKEMDDWFLHYTGKNVAIIISKRFFPQQQNIETFRSFAWNNGFLIE